MASGLNRIYVEGCTKDKVGEVLQLYGWVERVRELGGLLFLILRDHTGTLQCLVPDAQDEIRKKVKELHPEDVIEIQGKLQWRPEKDRKADHPTGEVELHLEKLKVLSRSKTPPFVVQEEVKAHEELRLTYRYLDLRRKRMQKNLRLRHQAALKTREILSRHGFIEVETPLLTRSTPEGARDFIVPSRIHPGKFYALPQSPQLFKQLLMVSGLDRYFQIARCFRDEDFRADRQPEFTQIDIEASFIQEEDIFYWVEELFYELFLLRDYELPRPFPRMSYREALLAYGTDRPNLALPLVWKDITPCFHALDFPPIQEVIENQGKVLGLHLSATFSRKQLENLSEKAKEGGLAGLSWIRWKNPISSNIKKYLTEAIEKALRKTFSPKEGDTLLIIAGEEEKLMGISGVLLEEAAKLGQIPPREGFFPLWITDFPLLAWNEEEKRWDPLHHPFTSPQEEDIPLLDSHPERVRARAYDVVVNGYELGGGSIRIHERKLQEKVFSLIGLSKKEAEEKFGFLLKAFQYGPPPHGGIALGFDRIVMLLAGETSIREVIAFPKTAIGKCLLTQAPAEVEPSQLEELQIKLKDR